MDVMDVLRGIGARIDGVVVIELALENKGKLTFNKPLMRRNCAASDTDSFESNLDYHILSGGLVHCLGKNICGQRHSPWQPPHAAAG